MLGIGKGGRRGGGKSSTPIAVSSDVTDAALKKVAEDVEGFSGREIAKMVASVQGAVYGSGAPELTLDVLRSVVRFKVGEHAARRTGFEKTTTPASAAATPKK